MPRLMVRKGLAAGLALFLVQNLALWSGWLFAAPGYQPLFHLQNHDSSQYLGFLTMARDHFLFPDLHAPWKTEPAMFNPIFLTGGRIAAWLGIDPLVMLNLLELFSFLLAGCVLVWVLEVFLRTRAQRVAAIVVALCAIPLTMFVLALARFAAPGTAPLFWLGAIELSFTSADGLFRGGLSNSPTLTLGAAGALLSLGLTAMRLRTGNRSLSIWLALTLAVSGAIHPFEVFVAAPCAIAGLMLFGRRPWAETALVALGAGIGLAPHVLLAFQHQWYRELSQAFGYDGSFGRTMLTYGLPFLAVPYLFLTGARPKEPEDKLLFTWWILTLTISLLPGAPFPPHLLDGFVVVTAMLVVRLAANSNLGLVYQKQRRAVQVMVACALTLTSSAYAEVYSQIARDGRSVESDLLLPAVAESDQMAVVDELRKRAQIDDLVLAPDPLSMMLVRVPMHSFASHEHLSFDFQRQQARAAQFYHGDLDAEAASGFLTGYGMRWVVVPANSPALKYFTSTPGAFDCGRYFVYQLPGNSMKAYPGIANVIPASQLRHPLTEKILQAVLRK